MANTGPVIAPILGVNTSQIYDPSSLTANTNGPLWPPVQVGTIVEDGQGIRWQMTRYTAAISQYAACAVQAATFTLATLTSTIASKQCAVGVPQIALTAPTSTAAYAFVAVGGPLTVKVKGGTTTGARLYSSSTAGKLSTSLTGQYAVEALEPLTTVPTTSIGSCLGNTYSMFIRGVSGNT